MNSRNGLRHAGRMHLYLFVLIMGAITLFTPAAQAETAAWTLANSGQFTNNSAWNTGIAPTNAGDTANITNKTAGYTVTLYNPTPTLTNNLLVVSNTTLVITQAVMNVTNTQVTSQSTYNNGLSLGALTLWSGGRLEIDNGGVLNITASVTNNDIQWYDSNGLVVLNSGGILSSIGTTNCIMCNSSGWTNHITSTTGSGGIPGSGGVFNYGGTRTLYVSRYATNSALNIDNGVTVSNINTLYLGANAGVNDTMWVTNGAALWINGGVGPALQIAYNSGGMGDGVLVSNNAALYSGNTTLGNAGNCTNIYLIVTSGSIVSNSGSISVGNSGGSYNNYMILNNSTLWATNSTGIISLGVSGANSNNFMIITNGSLATAFAVTAGPATVSSNDFLIVDHSTLNLGQSTIGSAALGIGNASGAVNNYAIINSSTVTMTTATGGSIDIGGTSNTLLFTGGSFLTNAAMNINNAGGCNNSATFNSSTCICVAANDIFVVGASAGTNNSLIATNNSSLTIYGLVIGNTTGATNNYAFISNSTLNVRSTGGGAIQIGNNNGSMSNSLLVVNSTLAVVGGLNMNYSANYGTNHTMTLNNSAATFGLSPNIGVSTQPITQCSPNNTINNGLTITNGASLSLTNMGAGNINLNLCGSGNYVLIAGTNSAGKQSILDLGNGGAASGNGLCIGGSPSSGCWVRVDAGGVISNFNYRCYVGSYTPGGLPAYNNTLIITNGGRAVGASTLGSSANGFNIGGIGASSSENGGNGGGLVVSGPGSVFDYSTNGAGNIASINLPFFLAANSGFGTNNYMLIDNGGLVKVSTNNGAYVSVGAQPNSTTNSVGNTVTILSGGTLEAMSYYATNSVGGNNITNYGGIYQFASPSTLPILTSSANGAGIYLNSGTIAYRSTVIADANCNQSGKPLDSAAKMTFLSTNIFRLNWATNQNYSHQAYVFDPNLGATNFYRLEMVTAGTPGTIPSLGGYTCYRGTNGDSLTIGTNVNSGGQMLCSNTTALVSLIFTNNGTLSIENSTLTLGANATINGGIVIDLNNLAAGVGSSTPVIQASSNLTINGTSTLTLLGGTSTNLSLIACSGTLSGKFGSISGLPQNTTLTYSSGKIALAKAASGSTLIFW